MKRPRRGAGSTERREGLRKDATAGVLLGIESVPDGLASGLLAGVNPVAGLYAYLFGMVGAAAFTSSTLMAVQATGAMALVVADTDLASREDPARALFTLSVLTGVIMVVVGLLRGGALLRFVPTAVMTGFVTAVGLNIVLGQLSNLTGYDAAGSNRVIRAIDLLIHPWRVDPASITVGAVTIAAILLLTRTRLGAFGLVVAVVAGSVLAALPFADGVELVRDIADVPRSLPLPVLPSLGEVGFLLIPAMSLAFVGLVQGAGVSVGVPNPDGSPSDSSRDFVGQGAGNVVAGLFQGMPVGGSMSASALLQTGGAQSRRALFVAGGVMAFVVLLLADLVSLVAMPSLAALLVVVGASAIRPAQVHSVVRTGPLQTTVMLVTLALTLAIPLQYAVLAGVGLAIVLFVVEQSNRLTVRALDIVEGRIREVAAPTSVPERSVVVLQPWGQLFFASAPTFEGLLPAVDASSRGSVVILRLRGIDQLGLSAVQVLRRYAGRLHAVGSQLYLVVGSDDVMRQLRAEGLLDLLGAEHVYRGNQWLGETVRRAHDDAWDRVRAQEAP